ncbi:MAG: hypothetical protein PHT62_10790 [Desulfotomaculaceae bacterium]|nr:hypothetical protein [Desulfotomaculaceae bacterium]
MIACVIAIISTAAFIVLWFWVVHRELRSKTDTVNSAVSQLAACRKNHLQTRDGPEEQDAKSIFSRSLDIYRQSVMLYNQALLKPWNLIPGFLLGFRQIKEGENI